ncbi:secreted and transmembrane protein 1 [Sorex araneus]|uniref:secreted and transmembrane protein 1 n=1 Tax=Sorex araneus TaxID=42254 RepID=UPI0024337127|nr:secreted and transmembrane protein 1 [Sorex araneus]
MCPRTALRLVPGMLCALLLLGGVLSTQQQGKEEGECPLLWGWGQQRARTRTAPAQRARDYVLRATAPHLPPDWDHPTCTQDPVTVPQGQQAVMTCNISNTYAQVIVSLTGPGGHSEELFDVKAPNYISRDGWQLRVQGRVAQLLVAKAELNQTGTYTWTLQGKQWEHRSTVLNVTEPPFGAAVGSGGLPWCGDPGCAGAEEEPRPAAGALRALPKDRSQSAVLWSVAFAALCVLALLCAVEGKRGRCMQFSATKCMEEQESDHMQLTSGLQP